MSRVDLADARADGGFDWLVARFAAQTAGVFHAILVSADGLPMARSEQLPPDRTDQMAAVASGLASLAAGAARLFEGGRVLQAVVEMELGYLLLMSVGDGSHLAVLAGTDADIGQVGYEMTVLVDRVGQAIGARARSALPG